MYEHMIARILHLRRRERVASPWGASLEETSFKTIDAWADSGTAELRNEEKMPATGDVARSQCPDQAAARRESSLLRYSCGGWWSFLGGARSWGGRCASASAEVFFIPWVA
jgi:hypothetical protein